MKTAFRRLLAAAHAFALSACLLSGGDTLVAPGGAEDFPNTVTTLGRIAVGDFSSSGQWEQVQDITLPEVPEISGLDELNVTPPLTEPGLPKRGLAKAADEPGDIRDTVLDQTRTFQFFFAREVRVYLTHETSTFRRTDTVDCLYLGSLPEGDFSTKIQQIVDSVRAEPLTYLRPLRAWGVTRSKVLDEWQAYRLTNLDTGKAMDEAVYTTLTTDSGGTTLTKRVRIYGPNGAYALPNPVPEEYELLRRGPARDTLEWVLIKDADYDRRLWAENLSGRVDLWLRVRNPASQPAITRMHAYMRANLTHRASLGDSLSQLFYQEQKWLRSGRNTTFTLQGQASASSLLRANDSARMTVDTVYALSDSMIRYTAIYNLRLGPVPDRMQEHLLLGFGINKFWRRGPVFSTVSVFKPDSAVAMGQSDFVGNIAFTTAYTNGDTVQTGGRITRDGLNLTLRQVKQGVAETYEVVMDAAGNLIRPPVKASPDATLTRRSSLP
jgi:hypothetical protein